MYQIFISYEESNNSHLKIDIIYDKFLAYIITDCVGVLKNIAMMHLILSNSHLNSNFVIISKQNLR
jgi:hypothetical protein